MTYLKPVLAIAAALSLSACTPETTTISAPGADPVTIIDGPAIAPDDPEAIAGTPGADSLDGTWNLVASQCGDPNSQGSLAIMGNKFTFPTTECTVATSEKQTYFTTMQLGCTGAANRQLDVSLRPGMMRMTEGETTLTYYRCT